MSDESKVAKFNQGCMLKEVRVPLKDLLGPSCKRALPSATFSPEDGEPAGDQTASTPCGRWRGWRAFRSLRHRCERKSPDDSVWCFPTDL